MIARKQKRLPQNYLEKYLGIDLNKADYEFIVGCINHQRYHFQLNNIQWEVIKKIEKKYLSKT